MSNSSNHSQVFKNIMDSPEDLADRIAEILDCPITIEDSKHQIISYSKHEKNVDDARIATIMRRKVPENVLNGLWKSGVMSKLIESDEPVIVPAIEKVGLGNRVAVSVRKNNEIIGFIWAQTNDKTLEEDKLQLLKEAALQVKSQLFQHHIKRRRPEENYKEFFWQLLTGHVNQKEIERQAKRFGLQLEGKLAIVMIEFDEEITHLVEKHTHYLTETLQQVQVVCRLFDDNQLLLLVRLGSKNDTINVVNHFIQDFINKITERLQIGNVKGASGSIYSSPHHIKDSYQQALKVLELKEKYPHELEKVYSYQELGIYQFLEELHKFRIGSHYQNSSIEKLRAYDLKNHSDLLDTLKVFLECDSNAREAAKVIHVHTNTLNYRLKRITEIAEIDLKDPNQKITLYIDLKLENIWGNL